MKSLRNLKLAARLGVAFGLIIVALIATTVVALSGLGRVDDRAQKLSREDRGSLGSS